MVSLATIRIEIDRRLVTHPLGLSADELTSLIKMMIENMSEDEQLQITRFFFWLDIQNAALMKTKATKDPIERIAAIRDVQNAKIVCANIELVRFGTMATRPNRSTKNTQMSDGKNSGDRTHPSSGMPQITHPIDLKKFLGPFNFYEIDPPKAIEQLTATIVHQATAIDDWCADKIATGDEPFELLELFPIMKDDHNDGNNRRSDMLYITVDQLVECLSMGRNATAVKSLAMNYLAVIRYYSMEANRVKDDHLASLTAENNTLHQDMLELKESNREVLEINRQLKVDMQEVLNHGRQANVKLDQANVKLDRMELSLDGLVNTVKTTLPMWIASSVTKTILDSFRARYTSDVAALQHLKVVFVCGFYLENQMKVYFCNTNFADVPTRLRKLSNKHAADMYMLRPSAITLASCDINMELVRFRSTLFDGITSHVVDKTKSFDIIIHEGADVEIVYASIIKQLRSKQLHVYQSRRNEMMDTINENGDASKRFSKNVIDHITTADTQFFDNTRPICQDYLNCHIVHDDEYDEFRYIRASQKTAPRSEFNNQRMSDRVFALMKINRLIDYDDELDTLNTMVQNGDITEEDRPILDAIARMQAAHDTQ